MMTESMAYPVLILCLDQLVHTVARPVCKDPTCPCKEQEPRPLHTAPSYLKCSCQRCSYVRSVLSEHEQWEQETSSL